MKDYFFTERSCECSYTLYIEIDINRGKHIGARVFNEVENFTNLQCSYICQHFHTTLNISALEEYVSHTG